MMVTRSFGWTLLFRATHVLSVALLLFSTSTTVASGAIKERLLTRAVTLPQPLQGGQVSFCTWGTCTLGPRLYHAPLPGGSTLVGWTDSSGNGHVTKVPESGDPITWDYVGEAVRGLVGHSDDSFAVLLHMPSTDGVRLSKRDAAGAQVWTAPLNSSMVKPAFLCGDARLAYGNGWYDAYFSVLGLPPCYCDNHYGDQYSQVSDAGVVQLIWYYGQTAHSMAQLAGYNPGLNRHTVISVSDCYPQKGLLADGNNVLFLGDGDCGGMVSVQLGGMATGAARWAVAFTAMTSGVYAGYGAGVAFFGASYTPSIRWITYSSGLLERDACIARLGGASTPERFLVGWRLQDTGVFKLCVIDSTAMILEGPEEVNSAGVRWGVRDDSFRTRSDGSVSWVEGGALSDTLRIHTYDPLATSDVGGPIERSPLSVAAAPNPFSATTKIRFAAAAPDLVAISIYDLQGRLVRRLLDGPWPSAEQAVEWDGRDDHGSLVVSGAYMVRLTSGYTRVSTRIIAVR